MEEIKNSRRIQYEMRMQRMSSRSVTAFVLGILSVVFCVVPVMLVAAVVGLMFERESEYYGFHKLQTPAKILCIVGIVLCSLVIVGILAVMFAAGILSR